MSGYSGYRVFMPYCLKRLADGRYIVLNRDYMPLGIHSGEKVDLESHPTAHTIHITAAVARKLSASGSDDLECIYLHGGKGVPEGEHWRAYADRLAVLMQLTVEVKRPYRIPPSSEPR